MGGFAPGSIAAVHYTPLALYFQGVKQHWEGYLSHHIVYALQGLVNIFMCGLGTVRVRMPRTMQLWRPDIRMLATRPPKPCIVGCDHRILQGNPEDYS
jgi:hypothetical protein